MKGNEYCLQKLHREIKKDINSSEEYIDAMESMTVEMKIQCPEKFKTVASGLWPQFYAWLYVHPQFLA